MIGKVRAAIQNNETEYTEIFHGGDNGYINTVGDGDLQFRHDDDTKMYLTDAGDLYVDGAVIAGTPTSTPVEGMIQYNNTINKLEVYTGTEWEEVGAFTNDNGVVRNTGSNNNDFLFGKSTLPSDQIFLNQYKFFFFDNDKGAFRAGEITQSSAWGPSFLGENSFAFGKNTLASGISSTAGGQISEATGNYSTAFGNGSSASGNSSFSSGTNTEAIGNQSVALGNGTVASGWSSTALGRITTAAGDDSFAAGALSTATGVSSISMGTENHASGNYSVAMGLSAEASGIGAVAMGDVNANSYRCVSIGRGNEGEGVPDQWVGVEPIFEVGVGTTSNPKNALTVLKNGTVGILRSNPGYPLQVGNNSSNGNGAFVTTGGTWTNSSSRTFKDHFESIDPREILQKLNEIHVSKWKYKESEEGYHLGPMAEDFYGAFGLGNDEKYISSVDADGVALAAIQGLYQENQQLKEELKNQKKEIEELKSMMQKLLIKISAE